METVEDLQLRSIQKVRTFSSQLSSKSRIQWLAVSSKFGLVIACCPTNQLIVYKCSDIHELNQTGTDQSETILQNQRKIDYYDSMCEIQFLKANFTGEILAIVVNKENEGSFVHLYDFRIFSIDRNDQPFPILVLPLSKQINGGVTAFEWNPAEDAFAAACSDKSLLTVQFNILEHNKLTLLGIMESPEIVNCISWSPKGKQLTCGDAAGRIHQMKPDLTLVRTIDPPQEIPELGNGPFRCVGLCWLSTTEWLVAHALHNKEQFNISVLVTKKNQASSWSFLGDITYSNLSSPAISTANVQFYSIFDWSMVFLSSPNSSEISVIGNRSGSAWTHWVLEDTFSIQLPVSKSHGETYPIGVGFDFCSSTPVKIANDGSGDLPPQPIIYVLTTEGLLLLYHIVSLNPQHPTLNHSLTPFSEMEAKNGLAPPNFRPRPRASVLQATSNQQKTMPSQNKTSEPFTNLTNPNFTNTSLPLSNSTNTIVSSAQNKTPVTETAKPNLDLNEMKKKAVEEAEKQFKNLVVEYCTLRNSQTRRIDLLKECRLKIDQNLAELNVDLSSLSDSIDEFPELIRDLVLYKDDLSENLERISQKTFDAVDRAHEVKALLDDIKFNKKSPTRDVLDFNNAKKMEILEDRYLNVLEKYEKMKSLLETLKSSSSNSQTQGTLISRMSEEAVISPMDQRKLNEATTKIATMILKFSQRLNFLNTKVRELQRLKKDSESKKVDRKSVLNRSKELDDSINALTDECTSMLNRMTVVVEQPSFISSIDDQDSEKTRVARQAILHRIMSLHSKEPISVRKVEPLNFLNGGERMKTVESREPQKNILSNINSTPSKQDVASRIQQAFTPPMKPKLVSTATQSPDWVDRNLGEVSDGSFLRDIGKTQTSTPKADKQPMFAPPSAKPSFSMPIFETPSEERLRPSIDLSTRIPVQTVPIPDQRTKLTMGEIKLPTTEVKVTPDKPAISAAEKPSMPIAVKEPASEDVSPIQPVNKVIPVTTTPPATTTISATPLPSTTPVSEVAALPKPAISFSSPALPKTPETTPVKAAVPEQVAPKVEASKPLFSFKSTDVPQTNVSTTPAAVSFSFKPPQEPAVAPSTNIGTGPKPAFSFKPPTTAQSSTPGFASFGTTPAGASTQRVETNDVGMEEDNSTSSAARSFGFLSTGPGAPQATPATTKSAFASGIFSQNKPPASSGFSFASPQFGGSSFPRPNQSTVTTPPSTFGSFGTPTAPSQPSFGGNAAFGGAPSFGGSAFGGGAQPFASSGSSSSGSSTFGGGSTGFQNFSNRSSAFGQLAQQSSPQASTFGGTQPSGTGFGAFAAGGSGGSNTSGSLFGGGTSFGSTGSASQPTQKSSAFTTWR